MLPLPTTINPEKEACCGIPTRVHPPFESPSMRKIYMQQQTPCILAVEALSIIALSHHTKQ